MPCPWLVLYLCTSFLFWVYCRGTIGSYSTYLTLRRTNVGLGSSFSNPLHHTLRTIITVTTTIYYYYYLQLLFALGPSYQNDKKNILKRKNTNPYTTLHYYSTQHAAGTMSVLERLREVFNLRAFAEEVRYTHTLSYSFVNSGPVSQPFSLSVSLLPPLPLFFFLSSKSASSGFEEERKERKKEREKDTWLLLLLWRRRRRRRGRSDMQNIANQQQ